MENLGPGVSEVIQAATNPDRTIDLKNVSVGDRLFIQVGTTEEYLLDFIITEPAKAPIRSVDDSARGTLPGWKWSSKLSDARVQILLAGSCSLNRGAPLGFSMLTIGKISLGRNLALWLDDLSNEFVVFVTPKQKATLWKVETQN